jgi:hypothetical protein
MGKVSCVVRNVTALFWAMPQYMHQQKPIGLPPDCGLTYVLLDFMDSLGRLDIFGRIVAGCLGHRDKFGELVKYCCS